MTLRIILTGGTGMVGRNLLEHPGIVAYDVYAPGREDLNLLDARAITAYVARLKPDLIVHCAGVVGGIQANLREPARFLVDNFEMGKNVVLAARGAKVRRLLNLGTSCMYPRDQSEALSESALLQGPLEPSNEGYALAKIGIERLCEYVTRENPSCQYKTVVPCNLYGRWDDFSWQFSHLLPAAVRKIHEAKMASAKSVEIWGDGTARREFMLASDLAEFLLFAIEGFDDLPQRLNVGPGVDHSVNQYYQAIAKVVGYEGRFVHNLQRPVGMRRKLLDVSAMKSLGWFEMTELTVGISRTYEFFIESESESGQ